MRSWAERTARDLNYAMSDDPWHVPSIVTENAVYLHRTRSYGLITFASYEWQVVRLGRAVARIENNKIIGFQNAPAVIEMLYLCHAVIANSPFHGPEINAARKFLENHFDLLADSQ